MSGFTSRWRLAIILLASLVMNAVALDWGVPNKNDTWAAESFKPLDTLAVARHAWGDVRWNSGWFYFKYPLGHPLVLLAAQVPYLAWLRAAGELHALEVGLSLRVSASGAR